MSVPFDGHARDLRQVLADRPANLLRSRMVLALQNRLKDGALLNGDRQAALAMGGYEPVQVFLFVGRTHAIRMIRYTTW